MVMRFLLLNPKNNFRLHETKNDKMRERILVNGCYLDNNSRTGKTGRYPKTDVTGHEMQQTGMGLT